MLGTPRLLGAGANPYRTSRELGHQGHEEGPDGRGEEKDAEPDRRGQPCRGGVHRPHRAHDPGADRPPSRVPDIGPLTTPPHQRKVRDQRASRPVRFIPGDLPAWRGAPKLGSGGQEGAAPAEQNGRGGRLSSPAFYSPTARASDGGPRDLSRGHTTRLMLPRQGVPVAGCVSRISLQGSGDSPSRPRTRHHSRGVKGRQRLHRWCPPRTPRNLHHWASARPGRVRMPLQFRAAPALETGGKQGRGGSVSRPHPKKRRNAGGDPIVAELSDLYG